MPPTLKALGIDAMSRDERLALVQAIWDTIANERESLLTEAQCQELDRRIAADDASPDDVIPWETVKAQALARLKR